jgi:hypothetical protein
MNMTSTSARKPDRHWYREPWPWLLMAGPAIVVVAGIVTAWIAIKSDDGLVADDYYKRGLAINQDLARSDRARALGLQAEVQLGVGLAELKLAGSGPEALPARVWLKLAHATQAGMDRNLLLGGESGVYRGTLEPPPPGRWRVTLEDEAATWRMQGVVRLPDETTVRLPVPGADDEGKRR